MSKATENIAYKCENKILLRLRNKRIIVEKMGEDEYYLRFIRTTTPEDRELLEESDNVKLYCRGKIQMTSIWLSRDAFEHLIFVMAKFIEEGML